MCIVFTKFPNQPKEQDLKTKHKCVSEINKLLRKIFKINDNVQLNKNDVYFIDTNIDKENEKFNQKNQRIVDTILKNIIISPRFYHPIKTENLDITGANAKIRTQQEIESLKNNLEEIKNQKGLAEREAQKANERSEQMKKEIQKMKNQIGRTD